MSDDKGGVYDPEHDNGEYLFVIDEQGRIFALDEEDIHRGKRVTSGPTYDMLKDLQKNGSILADLPVYGSCICIALDLGNFDGQLAVKRQQWDALLKANPNFLDGTFEERKAQWEALVAKEKKSGR